MVRGLAEQQQREAARQLAFRGGLVQGHDMRQRRQEWRSLGGFPARQTPWEMGHVSVSAAMGPTAAV
jgi:hypothetical protein